MKNSIKTHFTYSFCLLVVFVLIAINDLHCQSTQAKPDSSFKITIGYFKKIPNEIIGSGCNFYASTLDEKARRILLANDLGAVSYMKINNVLERFYYLPDKCNDTVFYMKNKKYSIKIETLKTSERGYECYNVEGIITVSDKNGLMVKQTFVGYCGW